jgi:hypothetical protein
MKRLLFLPLLLALFVPACSDGNNTDGQATGSPTPRLEVRAGAIEDAVLTLDEMGPRWTEEEDAGPSTIQVGGRVGAANVKGGEQDATSAFKQTDDSGYVTNSIFLLESADVAQAVIDEHRAATADRWTQERTDGGGARYHRAGDVGSLPKLGDDMYTAAINAVVIDAEGAETKRSIEYVVYRIDRILSFVIAQDVGVSTTVRRQERKVARLAS